MGQKAKIAFVCSGLGMGNAARITAIMECLQNKEIEIHVLTWGAGFNFFKAYRKSFPHFELTQIHSYANQKLIRFPHTYFKNILLLYRYLQKLNPQHIVLDSDYHFPAYLFFSCPITYIGQAIDVIERAKEINYQPKKISEWLKFILCEKLDAITQKIFADYILVPCFSNIGIKTKNVFRIPLIVRKNFLNPILEPPTKNLVVVASGSARHSDWPFKFSKNLNTTLVAPQDPEAITITDSSMIDFGSIIFTQGGLSSISECIARSRFIAAVPIDNHPEQFLNACEIERLGIGINLKAKDLFDSVNTIEKVHRLSQTKPSPNIRCDGADWVTNHLCHQLGI